MSDLLAPPPFEIAVDCSGETHGVEVIDGIPRARAHGVEERVLEILGGDLPPCMRCCDAVARAPWQLHWGVDTVLEWGQARAARILPPPPRARVAVRSASRFFGHPSEFASSQGEPPIDVTSIPITFRRLGWLAYERNVVAAKALGLDHVEARIQKWAACTLAEGTGLLGVRFDVGDEPGIELGGDRTMTIRLARDWLSTVMPFGLENVGGLLTLGARVRGDEVELMRYARRPSGEPDVRTERASLAKLAPGVHLLQGARA